MLNTAKPILETTLKTILYDSMFQAYKATFMNADDSSEDGNDMAMAFAKTCSEKMSGPLADAIHSYVSQIGIMITPTTLIAPPSGPVTGMANTETKQIRVY